MTGGVDIICGGDRRKRIAWRGCRRSKGNHGGGDLRMGVQCREGVKRDGFDSSPLEG